MTAVMTVVSVHSQRTRTATGMSSLGAEPPEGADGAAVGSEHQRIDRVGVVAVAARRGLGGMAGSPGQSLRLAFRAWPDRQSAAVADDADNASAVPAGQAGLLVTGTSECRCRS